jgi:hypothetical protein
MVCFLPYLSLFGFSFSTDDLAFLFFFLPSLPDWYRPPATRNGFVELYHHQAFWNNRMHPRVYKAFAQLWNQEKLWVSLDRGCMKVRKTKKRKN